MEAARVVTARPVTLDGGLGTRLETRGNDVSSSLWSAALLQDNPSEIEAAHRDFFAAGARVATTSSYQVCLDGFARVGRIADSELEAEVARLLTLSVTLAKSARSQSGLSEATALVAASVGPYGAALADGSEYTGDYGLTVAQLREWHRSRLRTLATAAPDLLLCETIPSLDEVTALAAELSMLADDGVRIPSMMSMTVSAGALRSGDSLIDAVHAAESGGVAAIGVNCSSVADATVALRIMRQATELPFIVYPNSGEVWDAQARSWSGSADELTSAVREWIELGARYIGGCCRVDVAEISSIDAAITQALTNPR